MQQKMIDGVFHCRFRVYAEDVDMMGIVYNANYLKFLERARTDWFRHHGKTISGCAEEGYQFALATADLKYIKPAKFDDEIEVVTRIDKIGKASILFAQEINLVEPEKVRLLSAKIKVACVNNDLRPCALPQNILNVID